MKSFLGWKGLREVFKPWLGTTDAAIAEEVWSETNELTAPAAGIGSDGSLEFIGLAAPPSVAAVEGGTSGTGPAVVPPDTVTKHALTHVFEIVW
jgi:hypothetical protein